MITPIDFEVSRETAMNLTQGTSEDGLRVKYRVKGTRRWTAFLLFTDAPVPDEAMPGVAFLAAQSHLSGEATHA